MAFAVKPTGIVFWSVASAGLAVLAAVFLLRDARPPLIAAEPACPRLPSNIIERGPALRPEKMVRITADPEWAALEAGMRPGDTVHEFETGATGGFLMLRGNCYLGRTVTWIR